jgi:YVTN family beta-propeller protein
MHRNNSNGNRAASARGSVTLCAALAMGLGSMARPTEAAPFAFVANHGSNNVSVIDTATNPPSVVATVAVGKGPLAVAVAPDGKHAYFSNDNFGIGSPPGTVSVIDTTANPPSVMATVTVGLAPAGIAVTPDGTHAYVTNALDGTVSVIDTTTNPPSVMAPVPVGGAPVGVAVTPDGKHAYVTNPGTVFDNVSVIDTATNTVVGTPIPVGIQPQGVAVTPDGKHAYVANRHNDTPGTVSVIDTASNMVVATVSVGVGVGPTGVAVTPDGAHAYVTNFGTSPVSVIGTVSVIDTASNMVVATVPVGFSPEGVAITPDGKHAYVANAAQFGPISVIDTTTNPPSVVATVVVGNNPNDVGIMPPPSCIPFLSFSALLAIDLDRAPKKDAFALESSFSLNSTASIEPVAEPVTLQIGTFTTTIPPGSFNKLGGLSTFAGVIGGVNVEALITPTGTLRYALVAAAQGANLAGTTNPVPVNLTIGDDCGTASVQARISR